ncbi:hypothetical protein BKA61DRAFT_29320 [Leptodontidium sp. MPI-SDFR-AT-0119]|nr:hypothetical protein BKA61DRAFT_29320 [Leptodontidium sp. MPI-SDFR-AT-0119]
MFKALFIDTFLCPLPLTAQMVTFTVICTGAASLCELEFRNSIATQTQSQDTIVPTYSKVSSSVVISSGLPTSPSSIKTPLSSSSTTQLSPPSVSLLTSHPQPAPTTTLTTPTPSPSSSPISSPHTESCICLSTGPFCAPQSTPRGKTFQGLSSKSLSGLPVAGTACPTSKDVLLTCSRVGGVPKVEKCKFMGFGWSVHCAESKVGVDSCGGV